MQKISSCLEARKEIIPFYHPYNFIKEQHTFALQEFVIKKLDTFSFQENYFIHEIETDNKVHYFYYQYLPWDSNYFNLQTCKLFIVLFEHNSVELLARAIEEFYAFMKAKSIEYIFCEVPAEDLILTQALCLSKSKLVEPRLTFYLTKLSQFNNERHSVKSAQVKDIPQLKEVARGMRNPYDRVHADPTFDQQKSDDYLATFAEESIRGFADIVLMPALEDDAFNNAFLAANYQKNNWLIFGGNVSKFVLTAVSSKTNRGWLKKLTSEMVYHLRDIGAEYISTSTQASNRAPIHTWESLGFKLGSTSFIFSTQLQNR